MTKTINKLDVEEIYLGIIMATYEESTAINNIILNGEKLKPFPLISGMRQVCLLTPLFFKHSTRSPG